MADLGTRNLTPRRTLRCVFPVRRPDAECRGLEIKSFGNCHFASAIVGLLFVTSGLTGLLGAENTTQPHALADFFVAVAGPSILGPEQADSSGNLGDFKSKVEVRYKAARKGRLQVFAPDTWKAGDTVEVKVRVNRAPEGSDGLTVPQAKDKSAYFTGLLKVDDDVRVKLSSAEAASVVIEAAGPETHAIRHILPGGHAEWIWHVKFSEPGQKHLTVNADVVYRRNFLLYEPPMVTFDSATVPVTVQVIP
jgi:hypothetical protein